MTVGGGERSAEKGDAAIDDSSFFTADDLDASPLLPGLFTVGEALLVAVCEGDNAAELEGFSDGFLVVCGSSFNPTSLFISSL